MTKGRPTIDGPHNRPSRICHTLNSFIGSCGSPTEGTWDAVYQRCPPLQTLVLRAPQHHNYALFGGGITGVAGMIAKVKTCF